MDSLGADADVAAQMLHQGKQLAPILKATLDPLAEELPAAITALRFAALLPPDTVPWPWLQALTTRRHPDLADNPVAWGKIERRLKGLQLLTEGEPRESVARIHRLIAAHLRKDTDAAMAEEMREYVAKRAWAIYYDPAVPVAWELDSLVFVLPAMLELTVDALGSRRELANAAVLASEKVLTYRSLRAAQQFLSPAHELLRTLSGSDPGNAGWRRDLSVSLNKLGDVAVALGDLTEARRLLTEDLDIARDLADSDPGNAEWQRDVCVSHVKCANLLERLRSREAIRHWRQAHNILARMVAAGLMCRLTIDVSWIDSRLRLVHE